VLSRFGRLALIAEELGEMDVKSQLLTKMKDLIKPWLTRTNGNVLLYDSTWGGIISKNGREDAGADYGMGWYNDKRA
jgi:endo-1,3(4)-beta-glucanase